MFSFLLMFFSMNAETAWPVSILYENMKIQIFKPETESFDTDKLSFRAALMVSEGNDNVFGSAWCEASLQINKTSRTVTIVKATVTDLRFPDGYAANKEGGLIRTIEKNLVAASFKMDDILADLENSQNEQKNTGSMDNTPPVIYYSHRPAVLVTIDGDPVLQSTDTKDVEMIINSPFLILKYRNTYYLSNGSLWYESKSPLAGWTPQPNVLPMLRQTAQSLKSDGDDVVSENSFYPEIIVSTVPAELIQTDGAPTFAAIPGTMMLYVSNSSEQIVMDIRSQMYFVLLSGRWYSSAKLEGRWNYIDFNSLPADFAKIPEGSEKDIVLASVPGTQAAQDAVRESLVPQAAIVDRKTATTEIVYDGEPRFEVIDGTSMRYAVNSSGTVIHETNRYYVVDNGVWFVGAGPRGPWIVSEARPVHVHLIPPSCPVYNVRYVHIYHHTPSVVYVGYTRGYLSSYVAGRVVVYGTGYRYRAWRGRCYYPRPCTWGYGVSYNPWSGWSVNYIYGSGWFGYSYPQVCRHYYPHYRYQPHYAYRCGWWGPTVYRPPYCVPHTHYYGNQRAQVRVSSRYSVTPANTRYPLSARNNVYASASSRSGVRSSETRMLTSASTRQNLTRSYAYQARPSASSNARSSSRSQTPSTRPASTSSANSRGSRGSAITGGTSNQGTRNPVAAPSQSSRSNSGTTQSTSSSRNNSGTTQSTSSSRNNSGSTQSAPSSSRSNSSSTQSAPSSSRSNSSSTQSAPSSSRNNSSSTQSTSSSRSNSSSTQSTSPSRNNSSSTQSNSSSRNNSGTTQSAPSSSRSNSSSTQSTSSSRSNSSSTQSTSSSRSSSTSRNR
jgi:hypothetical protein